MARGQSLISMLDALRVEIRASLNPAHNAQARDEQVRRLQNAQVYLWDTMDWTFLNIERTTPLVEGHRFYDPPTDVLLERIACVEVKWGGTYRPLTEGIGAGEYSTLDSELDQRSWPAEHWRIWEDERIEIWPIPAQNGNATDQEGYLKFHATKALKPLVDDGDVSTLDGLLIVLRAAMDSASGENLKKAEAKYKDRLAALQRQHASRRTIRMFGSSQPEGYVSRGPARVHYRTA